MQQHPQSSSQFPNSSPMQQPLQSSPQFPNSLSSPMQQPSQSSSQFPNPSPMPPPIAPRLAPMPEGPHWKALRTVAGLFKVLAWIELVVGLLVSLGAFVLEGNITDFLRGSLSFSLAAALFLPGLIMFLGVALIVGILFLFLYSLSELILLLIAIEKNTRPQRS